MRDANKKTQLRRGAADTSPQKQILNSPGPIKARIVVSLILYADESGTHDITGAQRGSRTPVVSGFVDTTEAWAFFRKEWKAVLDKPIYKAPYFHFSELGRTQRAKKDNPFHGWSEEKVRCFIYDLATVVTRSAVSIGGISHAPVALKHGIDPFETMFGQFFKHLAGTMSQCWPSEKGPVHLFYDGQFDKRWDNIIRKTSAVAAHYGVKVAPISFDDKERQLPLQAADMLAHSERSSADSYYQVDGGPPVPQPPRILDWLLRRNAPDSGLSGQPMSEVKLMAKILREEEEAWEAKGNTGHYYPHQHQAEIRAKMQSKNRRGDFVGFGFSAFQAVRPRSKHNR